MTLSEWHKIENDRDPWQPTCWLQVAHSDEWNLTDNQWRERSSTVSKWRRLCLQAGQLILYALKPCDVNVSIAIQKWIARIETTGHESSCKQFCTIQIKVTADALQIRLVVGTWATDCWYMWAEDEIVYQLLHQDSEQILQGSFWHREAQSET